MADEDILAITITENSAEVNENGNMEENVTNGRGGNKINSYSIDENGEINYNEEKSGVFMADEEKRILRIIKKIEKQRNRACYQNVLELARRESSKIDMDICKYIILDLTKRKLVLTREKLGKANHLN